MFKNTEAAVISKFIQFSDWDVLEFMIEMLTPFMLV